ncbi:MAG: caspase family protein [Thermoplasmatales archaeon]|nr:MAG: caspase family protein [Thermoplasmatales archaeon]
MNTYKKGGFIKLVISIVVITLMTIPVCNSVSINFDKINVFTENEKTEYQGDSTSTEYWALLVGVGVYYNNPDENRPSMLEAVDMLYASLLSSPNWQADHIHVLKGSQATLFNLIRELIWLIRKEGRGDMTLLYITTHGYGLKNSDGYPMDLPPKDETDGDDEALVLYYGFDRWYDQITDDMLRFFLKFLQSDGLCMIIDSCFSGGFNDPIATGESSVNKDTKIEEFKRGFLDDIAADGRVIMMSSQEEEYSYGSTFSELLIEGFNGWADLFGNNDGINSAEESFNFAYPWVVIFTGGDQHPTIVDLYPGEFPITYN